MQFKTIVAISLAAVASAQDLSKLPPCAAGPAISAIGSSGCSVTDAKCICLNKSFIATLQPLVEKACAGTPGAVAQAAQFAVDFCKSAGVDLQLPGGASSSAPASAPASSAPASSAPASSAPASSTPAKTSAAATSAAATSGYAAPTIVSSVASNATSHVATSSPPQQTIVPGAAANVGVKGGMVVLAAAVGAVFAL